MRVVSRGSGSRLTARNVVAAAAYNARDALYDERLRETHNYAHRSADLVESEVLLPPLAPYRWFDREVLWNEVEWGERQVNAQLARSVILTLPRELDPHAGADLARDYLQSAFVRRGMVVDMAVHTKTASDGGPQPHAHALLTMRRIVDGVFGLKERAWNGVGVLHDWREQWAELANRRLAEHGISARLDHRRDPSRTFSFGAAGRRQAMDRLAARAARVAEIAKLARGFAIIGAAVTTQAMRDVARRMGFGKRERSETMAAEVAEQKAVGFSIRERTLQKEAIGVATGAWTYGQAVDRLVTEHLVPAARRNPEINARFDEIVEGMGSAVTERTEEIKKRIAGNAAILRERSGQQVTTQSMRDVARQVMRVSASVEAANEPAQQAQQANRRAQEASATNELILG